MASCQFIMHDFPKTAKKVKGTISKGAPATSLSSIDKKAAANKEDTSSHPPSATKPEQKAPDSRPPFTRLQTDKLLKRVQRSLSLTDQAPPIPIPLTTSPTLTAPVPASPFLRQRRRRSRRPPSLKRETASLGSSLAGTDDASEGLCYEQHHIGYAGPPRRDIAVQAWMNGVDGPRWEDIMGRATEVARDIWEKLGRGDTRADWCAAGNGAWREGEV